MIWQPYFCSRKVMNSKEAGWLNVPFERSSSLPFCWPWDRRSLILRNPNQLVKWKRFVVHVISWIMNWGDPPFSWLMPTLGHKHWPFYDSTNIKIALLTFQMLLWCRNPHPACHIVSLPWSRKQLALSFNPYFQGLRCSIHPLSRPQCCQVKNTSVRTDILFLPHCVHKFNFFFLSPLSSCPFLFSLTLVTDDKSAFLAKPINKLNREKMSI